VSTLFVSQPRGVLGLEDRERGFLGR
jgi:hypothetical protein